MAYYKKPASTTAKVSVYEIVTDRIISIMEKGIVPWNKPAHQIPATNLISKKVYKGVNTMLLGFGAYSSPYWLSFKQAKDLGGYVNAGEKGHIAIFWTQFKKDKLDHTGQIVRDANGNAVQMTIPCMRYYTIFNSEQCTIPEGKVPQAPVREVSTAINSVVANYEDCPEIEFGNFDCGSYSDALDIIKMPVIENFTSIEDQYATLFHELIHSTRNSKRLNRKEAAETYKAQYGREELVAEIGAAFLYYEAGIENTIPNQAAYIQNWIEVLQGDKRLVVAAASAAQKAAEYILRNNAVIAPVVAPDAPAVIADDVSDDTPEGDVYGLL